LLKKCGLEFAYNNLRPISNLSYLSKLVETAVADQLKVLLENNNLYSDLQSLYRKYYCTETALLKVRNDILLTMNQQRVTLLIMLDLSAAFDTVHHGCLLNILNSKLGLDGIAPQWFDSYLKNRSYRVSVNGELSKLFYPTARLPQGSCLGPLLFNIYASGIFNIVKRHLPQIHCYAGDSQLYLSFNPEKKDD